MPSINSDSGSVFGIDFNNPTCIMWAVMALARLNEKLPLDSDCIRTFRLRIAIDDAIQAFCDYRMEATWSTLYSDRACQIVGTLQRTAADYYQNTEGVQNPDVECEYLLEVFSRFHTHVHQQDDRDFTDAYGAIGMMAAMATKMTRILGRQISEMVDTFNDLSADGNVSSDAVADCTNHQIDLICAAIEQFVREPPGTNSACNSASETRTIVGQSFVRLIHDPLRQRVESAFRVLINDLAFCSCRIVNKHHYDVKERIVVFYMQISTFFTYDSPLLSAFFIPDMSEDDYEIDDEDYEEYVPEYVANHDFSRYDDFDWHTREYEIFDVQDVLRGPEHADLACVSTALSSTDESCPICGDADVDMRKLNVCSHEVCATCLDAQLKVQHQCRYRCPLCRAEFFPD